MNLFYCRGIRSESFAALLNGMILSINKAAVIITAVITTHHEIALRFRLKLRYLVICDKCTLFTSFTSAKFEVFHIAVT